MSTTAVPTDRRGNEMLAGVRRQLANGQSFGIVLMLVIVICVTYALKSSFLGSANIANVATNAAILAIVGFGMTMVIAMAGLDLSVGSVQALTAILAAQVATSTGVVAAVAIAIAVGAAVGMINGLIIARFAVPAFIATLGMASVIRGTSLIHVKGGSVLVTNESFGWLGSGRVLGIPVPVLVALLVFGAFLVLLRHTRFGRHVIAAGGNKSAAVASGLNINRLLLAVYAISGATAGLAGVLLAAQLRTVDGSLGQGFELDVIAVAVVGGASLAGGRANLTGTLIAALLISSIESALNILNVQSYYQYLALGLLLIAALSFDSFRRRLIGDSGR
jgi:ribose/xylose/arabinose/galactoside ABC-type transport system permease subunit